MLQNEQSSKTNYSVKFPNDIHNNLPITNTPIHKLTTSPNTPVIFQFQSSLIANWTGQVTNL